MKIVIVGALCLAASAARADGTRVLASKDGACAVAVPDTWKSPPLPGTARSPDKKLTIIVQSLHLDIHHLEANVKKTFKHDKVTRETATEIELEGPGLGKPHVYRGIAGRDPRMICAVDVSYTAGSLEEPRRLAARLTAK